MYSIRSVLVFFTLVISLQAFGQEQNPEAAREYFESAKITLEETNALDLARELYIFAAEADTTFVQANFEAGHVSIRTIGKEGANKFFLRVLRQDPDFRFDIHYWIGRSYQYALDFDNAKRYYNLYKSKLQANANYQGKDRVSMAEIDMRLRECVNGKTFVANPGSYSIVNIGDQINSEYDDFGPVISEAEDELVFTSRRRDGNQNENVADDNFPYEDIYHAFKSGGNWTRAENVGTVINKQYHDSNLAMSADGQLLFVYNDDNGGDIYYCERQSDRSWGPPIPLPGFINSTYQEKSISISKDENTLYFTSNRPGGFGRTDIYKATKNSKGEWSNVKNLGPKINTPLGDDGPFIDYDGVTLYFSSQGHDGMGGYDIYKSKYDASTDTWSDPENLGYPINTPDNDIYFTTSADSKRAYYSSVKENGLGFADIYIITSDAPIKDAHTLAKNDPPKTDPPKTDPPKVDPPKTDPIAKPDTTAIAKNDPPKTDPPKTDPPKEPVKNNPPKTDPPKQPVKNDPPPKKELKPLMYVVKVVDSDSKTPLSAKVSLRGQKDNVVVGLTPKGDGVYEFKITNGSPKDYRLSIEADGYVFINQNLRIGGASEQEKTVDRTIEMRRISVGVVSILRNIYFDYDRATFKTDSYAELNKLESMLRQNANMRVEIGGHTDAYGKWDYNKQLSQKRAQAVKDYLVKKGIDPRRVKATGYGETKPLASNDDEDDGRELNRRVEFKVLQN